jgi:hypothetical protein
MRTGAPAKEIREEGREDGERNKKEEKEGGTASRRADVTKSPVAHGKKIVTNCDSLGCIKIETMNTEKYPCARLWGEP